MNRLRRLLVTILVSGFAAALAALALFAWLAEEVIDGDARAVDEAARRFVQHIASPMLTNALRGFTFVGEWLSIAELTILAILLFYREGRKRASILMTITIIGGAALETILKHLFHRVRPSPFFDTPLPSSYSFPSGHAMLSCCFFGSLAALLAAREPKRSARIAIWTAGALLAAVIGFSRVYLGVHYASDVIAGYASAAVWVFTVRSVYVIRLKRSQGSAEE